MVPTNPFAPPETPLGAPSPPPEPPTAGALWLFPTGLSAGLAVACLILSAYAIVLAIGQHHATGGNWAAGTPIVRRSVNVAIGSGVAGIDLGLIAYAWHRRRWLLALALMALCAVFLTCVVWATGAR